MMTRTSLGLTLIELVVCICIAVTLICISTPFFNLISKNKIVVTEQKIFSALQFARIQSITQHKNTLIQSSNWNEGFMVSFENDNLPLRTEVFHGVNIDLDAFNTKDCIKFFPDGRSLSNGHFTLSSKSEPDVVKKIYFQQGGRIRVESIHSQ